jgi:hypothetical protein
MDLSFGEVEIVIASATTTTSALEIWHRLGEAVIDSAVETARDMKVGVVKNSAEEEARDIFLTTPSAVKRDHQGVKVGVMACLGPNMAAPKICQLHSGVFLLFFVHLQWNRRCVNHP